LNYFIGKMCLVRLIIEAADTCKMKYKGVYIAQFFMNKFI